MGCSLTFKLIKSKSASDTALQERAKQIMLMASLRRENPSELVVAVPVAPHDAIQQLKEETDKVVVVQDSFHYLGAVGAYYEDFPQLMDQEVIDLLKAK